MKQPVDHILRPQLPWRSGPGVTECGYDASKTVTLTRDAFFVRVKEMGSRRAAMLTCMTCSDTAERHGTWSEDPRTALQREIEWECRWRRTDRGTALRDELFAIAALIEAHREEFDAHVVAMQRQREWVEKKAARTEAIRARPKIPGGL